MSRTPALTHVDPPAPPWNYNPSAWKQRVPICLLAGVAFVMSTYMALYQWRLIPNVWDPVFGGQSRAVLDSDVSEQIRSWIGIPDAALGALAYLGDLVFGLAGSTGGAISMARYVGGVIGVATLGYLIEADSGIASHTAVVVVYAAALGLAAVSSLLLPAKPSPG